MRGNIFCAWPQFSHRPLFVISFGHGWTRHGHWRGKDGLLDPGERVDGAEAKALAQWRGR